MIFNPAALLQPDRGQPARLIHVVHPDQWESWLKAQPPRIRTTVAAHRLTGKAGNRAVLPGDGPDDWAMLLVCNESLDSPWRIASLGEQLPEGIYRLAEGEPGAAMLGWALAQHKFDRYRSDEVTTGARVLLTGEPARIEETVRLAQAVASVRDLVNTAAADLGPAELEGEAEALAKAHGASVTVTKSEALVKGYPMIHAVGQAAAKGREPRLIELEWGNPAHPRIAIIGKGVCFDSGGLDIKPSSGMRLMKKDMGGAAHALALAGLVMAARLPVRLHLLIPAVENSIAGNAFRPGDVLRTRKGLTVENTNTDAEGRLVLGDAITRAAEETPTLILDFATLTGAARVALGPDLPATFANDDALAEALLAAGTAVYDPLWRMPLWDGYDDMLSSDIADMVNAPDGGFAGAVTAALFLRRFVPEGTPWAHFDTFAWRPSAKPGRPKGGEALGLRAAWAMLKARYPG
ncbi:leucyl aminopeptidase [Sphingomonas sp. BE270]|jgi:leucyl aminopeptidase|uniref:leucyl aminopeptidase family protein n=1 Tax=unclassified Sphingomonas TaxID=196159 RepID=UPI00053E3A9F|nr:MULTISPECIES: leucyl aminopeptidase family protein [unclassified Sphingomonas]MDR6849823.1 leucyl aminopeptidase [Sphingomonas sp. BE137]MDR7257324.1 leucyl aminopeptidase [Sphingomonas sp. BE270]